MKKVLVIVLMICAFISIILLFRSYLSTPEFVEVKTPNGETLYPIDEDKEFFVEGRIGKVTIEIKGKRVRVKESSCPNKVCVKTGWIRRSGEIIVCAPNQVTVRILPSP